MDADELIDVSAIAKLRKQEMIDASWNKALEKAVEIVMESDLVSQQVKGNLVGKIKMHLK